MKAYLLAEHLKIKYSMLKKLALGVPLFVTIFSYAVNPPYFSTDSYNWWYVAMMPVTLSLMTALIHQNEQRKLSYRALYSLDVNLKLIFQVKTLLIAFYFLLANVILLISVGIGQEIFTKQRTIYPLSRLVLATTVLFLVNLWQIPLVLYLAKRWGFLASIISNSLLAIILGIAMADTNFWWLCPYSWSNHLMIAILKILPNGMPTITNIFDLKVLLAILIFALSFGVILTSNISLWLSKREA